MDMDTPLSKSSSFSISNKLINTPSSNSPAFQDSPVFNYISNLSPIQPVKAEPSAQGFPGLSSPPLLFTSPRINSLQSLLNRKLQSSGSLEYPHGHNKCHKNDEDPGNLAKASPECIKLFDSEMQRACTVKNLGQVAQCSPGCIDDFLSDPDANSSCKPQSDDTSLPSRGVSLQKRDNSRGENADLYRSAPIQVKKGAHAKSRISIKVVKNEARHLMPSSECLGSLPRLLTEPAFEACQNGESLNEASQFERGTLRRCLFEENQKNYADDSDFRNFSDNLTRIEELNNLTSTGTQGNRKIMKRPNTAIGSCALPPTESNHVPISKPLGIGLHLNSVVYPRSLDSSSGSQQSSLAGLDRKNSVVTGNQLDTETNATIVGKVSTISEEKHHNNASSIATSGEAKAAKPLNIEHFYSPVLSKQDARTAITCPKRKISASTAESDELHCKLSPKKKRKKSSDDDTSKRCNCKKTKCLKLYCDCFAAGLYCTESCACQGCCNHLENEDTVLETRQQIETRNPLAFAPKVVQPVTDSPAADKEVQNLSTPSSARHKIGCNCKKSMCLKKYCECYQANVGCSDGCRCEGCKNVFGIRKDYSVLRGFMVRNAANEVSEAIVDRRQENTIVGSNFDNSRVHNSPNLTPPTPALQCSDARKNAPKSKLPFMRDLQTPEFQNEVVSSDENFLTCPENSQSHGMLLKKTTESIDEDAFHSEKVPDSAGDESSSTSRLISNSVATLMIPPSSSKTNNIAMSSSLRWRSSPITPITQSVGLKFQDLGSGSKHFDMTEDDTPNVLKDSSTPAKSVKVSSPNKKRISAPRNPVDSFGSLGDDCPNPNPTDSAGSLKICHRFVLQSLPTFPSLTPFSKKQQ